MNNEFKPEDVANIVIVGTIGMSILITCVIVFVVWANKKAHKRGNDGDYDESVGVRGIEETSSVD